MEERESHPIPQDVTGFQFKLIGDMTVKQFAYLAGPITLAWIFFQLPLSLLIKVPVSLVLGGIGASLAFLPIAGRPMDVMITNFTKALFNSTLYIYRKRGMINTSSAIGLSYQKPSVQKRKIDTPEVSRAPVLQTQVESPVVSMHSRLAPVQGAIEKAAFQQASTKPKIQQVKDEDYKKRMTHLENLKKEGEVLEKKSNQEVSPPQPKQTAAPRTSSTVETLNLQEQLQTVLNQKDQLTKQLMTLQEKLNTQKESYFTPTIAKALPSDKATPKMKTQNVRQVPKSLGKNLGLPTAPEDPNVITGIIKDPRGNPLGNILVEIKDATSNPVRAFKTNGLGRFASATPLANGVYTISFDDPKGQNKFDSIELAAKGEVILPLEAISIDTREELRKTLFKEN